MKKTIKVTQEVVITADTKELLREAIKDIRANGLFQAVYAGDYEYKTKDKITIQKEVRNANQ